MKVFRITSEKYSHNLNPSGRPNRWNLENQFVIYSGSSRSLSTLELLVHRASIRPSSKYRMMVIELSDEPQLYSTIDVSELPISWRKMQSISALQHIGSAWYESCAFLVLKVPSVIIPEEANIIINTRHPAFFDKVKLLRSEEYFWDNRLL